jgi:hypothetical protein
MPIGERVIRCIRGSPASGSLPSVTGKYFYLQKKSPAIRRAEGRGPRAEGRGPRAEGRGLRAEG